MIRQQVQQRLTGIVLTLKDTLLHVSIRLGKTKIALDAIEPGDKVLWIYPSNAMLTGYLEDMIKFPPKSMDIKFTNISSIKKFVNTDWDFIIVDEIQRCTSAAQIKALKTLTYRKRVGLSGTMNDKTLELLRKELNWTVGAKYTLEDGIRDGAVKDYKVYIHFSNLCNNNRNIEIKKFGKSVMATEQEAYDSYCSTMEYFDGLQQDARARQDYSSAAKAKMGYIKYMGLRTNLLYNSTCLYESAGAIVHSMRNKKVLIYALRTEIADALSEKSYHSKNKDDAVLEEFRTSENGHLAVVDMVTTGITIRNLNNVIFHSYDSNTENFHQKLGRALLHEGNGHCANVHVCTLRGTQNEKWIERACESLEMNKIFYVIDGVTDTKIKSIKKMHNNAPLFMIKENGKIIVWSGVNSDGMNQYFFPGDTKKTYNYSPNKLKQL